MNGAIFNVEGHIWQIGCGIWLKKTLLEILILKYQGYYQMLEMSRSTHDTQYQGDICMLRRDTDIQLVRPDTQSHTGNREPMQISKSKGKWHFAVGCRKSSVKCCGGAQRSQDKYKRALSLCLSVCMCARGACVYFPLVCVSASASATGN